MASKSESRVSLPPPEQLRFDIDLSFKLCVAIAPILALLVGVLWASWMEAVPEPKSDYLNVERQRASRTWSRDDAEWRAYFDYHETRTTRFVVGYLATAATGLVACLAGSGYYLWQRRFGSFGFLMLTVPFYLLVSYCVLIGYAFRQG